MLSVLPATALLLLKLVFSLWLRLQRLTLLYGSCRQ
jgi:hypothetical protein